MIYVKGKTKLPEDAEKKLMEELANYRLVVQKTISWEKLDDDRSGEDTEEKVYTLIDPQNFAFDILIIIDDEDYSFLGIEIRYKETTCLKYNLSREHLICALYVDGTKKGRCSSTSTHETPNNYYETVETYLLRRI